MALRLFRKGGYPDKHWKLGDRDLPDQHPIEAITGLTDALNEIETIANNADTKANEAKVIANNAITTVGNIITTISDFSTEINLLKANVLDNTNNINLLLDRNNIYEVYKTITSQQQFVLSNDYIPGSNTLEVYVEGVLLKSNQPDSNGTIPIDWDYEEFNEHTVNFVPALEANQTVVFKMNIIKSAAALKRSFTFINQTQIICNHNLNTKKLHISVYVNDIDISHTCTKQRIDMNNIKVTSATPITGEIIIS